MHTGYTVDYFYAGTAGKLARFLAVIRVGRPVG
jgi:hypothetical protein